MVCVNVYKIFCSQKSVAIFLNHVLRSPILTLKRVCKIKTSVYRSVTNFIQNIELELTMRIY